MKQFCKTTTFLMLILCVILMTCACSSSRKIISENEHYTIYAVNDQYILTMKDTFSGQIGLVETPIFSSVVEMRQAILTGDLSDAELLSIRGYEKNALGETILCDLNNLYTPIVPEGISVGKVSWSGDEYQFALDTSQSNFFPPYPEGRTCIPGLYGNIRCVTKEYFYKNLKSFTEFTQKRNIEILSQTEDPMSGGTIYTCRKKYYDSIFEEVLYTMSDGNKTIYVRERKSGQEFYAWGIENGSYFIAYLRPQGRLDPNWVFSFGLTPYVEDSVNP